ncbi:MAG: polyprenol phosphomannose-dependent alpha 1,6 mannosyltransferase MptB, partial [Flavobacteriales bacterium]
MMHEKCKGSWRGILSYGVLPLLYTVGLILLGYLIPRTAFWTLFSLYTILFGIYLFEWGKGSMMGASSILFYGLIFRLALLGMDPNWSDDVARFIWDGRIVAHGEDPFEAKPSKLLGTERGDRMGLERDLYQEMNSPDRYSVYPPVKQYIFGGTALIAGMNTGVHTVLLRILLLLADLAVALALMRLLAYFQLPRSGAALYFLNPLVILEGVGNLHFEVLLLAFFLWGTYLALKGRGIILPGLLLGAAVSTKLIPLLFLPFFLKTHRWRALSLYAIVGLSVLLSFWPWLTESSLLHFLTSLKLYFQTFEFNASIYELVKWGGYQWTGYNIISRAGPALSIITFVGVMTMLVSARLKEKQDLFSLFVFALSLHLFLATTVHPWYILPLIAFLPLTP